MYNANIISIMFALFDYMNFWLLPFYLVWTSSDSDTCTKFREKVFIRLKVIEPNPKAHPRTPPGISYETMENNVSLRGVGGGGAYSQLSTSQSQNSFQTTDISK